MRFGASELIVIAIIVLGIFLVATGGKKLPEIAKNMKKSKETLKETKEEVITDAE